MVVRLSSSSSALSRGSTLLDAIEQGKKQQHDTLYCNKEQSSQLRREISMPHMVRSCIDETKVRGLDVEVLPVSVPIICRKGDVFDLAKDYKNEFYRQ